MKSLRLFAATVVCLAVAALPINAQTNLRLYGVYQEVSLTSAAAVVTVQQPATGARTVTFEGALIYCSVACLPALEINGTAAANTTASVIKANTKADAAKAVVFTGSDVGSGTVLFKYNVSAGSPIGIKKSGLALAPVANHNFTFRTDAITGTVRMLVLWSEQ